MQWSPQMIHVHILQLFYFCVLHPSRWTLFILFEFFNPPPYYWGSINDCIMKTHSEPWQSFSITIWWTSYINITCLPFLFFLHIFNVFLYLLYSHFYNIISIWISKLIFWIVYLSNLLFVENTTPVVINKFSPFFLMIYICHKILYHYAQCEEILICGK